MKIYPISALLFLLVSLVSCSTSLDKSKFYSDKKVGIIIEIPPIDVTKVSLNGHVNLFATETITQNMLQNIDLNQMLVYDSIKNIVVSELEKNNKEFIIINEKDFSYGNLSMFRKPKDHKKYPKKDFRIYKTYGVDQIIYVKYEIGLIYKYMNGIYVGKNNAYSVKLYIVDLSDNSLLQYEVVDESAKSYFKRDDTSEENLKILNDEMNTIFNQSLEKVKEKY